MVWVEFLGDLINRNIFTNLTRLGIEALSFTSTQSTFCCWIQHCKSVSIIGLYAATMQSTIWRSVLLENVLSSLASN
jgi:hypothetical protein